MKVLKINQITHKYLILQISTQKNINRRKRKGIFQTSYDNKPFTVGIKAFSGIIKRGKTFKREKFITVISEVTHGLL